MKSSNKNLDLINFALAIGNERINVSFNFEQIKQLKQDLEFLEILKVLILHNFKSVGTKGFISDFEVMFRLGKITQEQLDTIKNWAKENENEKFRDN